MVILFVLLARRFRTVRPFLCVPAVRTNLRSFASPACCFRRFNSGQERDPAAGPEESPRGRAHYERRQLAQVR